MLEGILFDYDGVIAKTHERQFNWFKFWSQTNKTQFPFENITDFMVFYNQSINHENGIQNVYDDLKLPCDISDQNHPVWSAYNQYKTQNPIEFYEGMTSIIPQIHEICSLSENTIRNQRVRMGINTTNSWKTIHKELKEKSLLPYFDSFVSYEIMERYAGEGLGKGIHKPSKVSLHLSLERLGTNCSSTLFFGDSLTDLKASVNLPIKGTRTENLITVGCSWGYEGKDRLKSGIKENGKTHHFDYLIDNPNQMLDLVKDFI